MPDYDYILESLRQAAPMLRNLAIRYELDYDDLYQDAFLVALDCYEQAMTARNPRGFIQARLRWYAVLQVRTRSYCPSLPLDVIGELPVKTPVDHAPEKREQALYTALQRLTIQQQRALTDFFGLAAYEPVANGRRSWRATATNKSAAWERRKKGLAELRRDQALREAVQV